MFLNPFENPSENMPPARVLRARMVDNTQLALEVYYAARTAAMQVIGGLPRDRVAWMCHALLSEVIPYVEENDDQYLRMPWRTFDDWRADCKSQSILAAALAHKSGCDVALRYVMFEDDDHFSHVYPIIDGIVCDPLLPFGEECEHAYHETLPLDHAI